jgi:hypothetical protein
MNFAIHEVEYSWPGWLQAVARSASCPRIKSSPRIICLETVIALSVASATRVPGYWVGVCGGKQPGIHPVYSLCLLAAVPLTVFCLDYCIRYPACSLREIAARELKTVQSSVEFDTWPDQEQEFKMPRGVTKASVRASDA